MPMSGFCSSFAFTLTLNPTKPSASSSPSLSSSLSNTPFRLRLPNPTLSTPLVSSAAPISARYGGGGGFLPGHRSTTPDRYSSPKSNSSNEDQALDISGIRSASVRLIDKDLNTVGVVPKGQALEMAEDAGLDLVIISPDADPPVVRVMDYNKYKFDQQKKKKDQQKKTNRVDMKVLKMRYYTDTHDYNVRLKAAIKYLKNGDKVKLMVELKGRENDFKNEAIKRMTEFQADIGELAIEESKNFSDRKLNMVLVPNKAFLQKAQERQPKNNDKSAVTSVSASV